MHEKGITITANPKETEGEEETRLNPTDEDTVETLLFNLSLRWYYLGRKGWFVLAGDERLR